MTGVINLLKPPGMTSQNAVTHVKRILSEKKAGHAGTLDPAACGVLPICLGRATKLAAYMMDGTKEYLAELTLGVSTDTLDGEGHVTDTVPKQVCSREAVEEVLASLRGPMLQTPPAYSAVKIKGKPLYAYARAGCQVVAKPRAIEVYSFQLIHWAETGPLLFRICCSKGTYVRVLLAEVAERLRQAGYTSFLMRTRVGRFIAEDSVTLAELAREGAQAYLLPPREIAPGERIELPRDVYPLLKNGARVPSRMLCGLHIRPRILYAVSCAGDFFGLGEYADGAFVLQTRLLENTTQSDK